MIRIGDLNKRLTIQEPTRTDDGAGGFDVTWSDLAMVWAKIISTHGGEKIRADAITSSTKKTITIRFYDGLTPDMRFTKNDRLFEIKSIINVGERGRWLECLCQEKPA